MLWTLYAYNQIYLYVVVGTYIIALSRTWPQFVDLPAQVDLPCRSVRWIQILSSSSFGWLPDARPWQQQQQQRRRKTGTQESVRINNGFKWNGAQECVRMYSFGVNIRWDVSVYFSVQFLGKLAKQKNLFNCSPVFWLCNWICSKRIGQLKIGWACKRAGRNSHRTIHDSLRTSDLRVENLSDIMFTNIAVNLVLKRWRDLWQTVFVG